MDLKEIQKLLGDGGGKVVIVENGNPVMIILPYKAFQEKVGDTPPVSSYEREEQSILPESGELTLDDLPL
ncbi:MAG: hypothetical protein HY482_01755 [Candidatus Wildermuthbacteria bacterium]|nr:hypothetical protein [Candidatus Wildermuthbacteria bacterium]